MADKISIFDVSVNLYTKGVTALVGILQKASTHADAETFPSARLIDDMEPLTFQVAAVSDLVVRSLRKMLGNAELRDFEEPMSTMEDLIERAEQTLTLLKGIDAETCEGRESMQIDLPLPMGPMPGKQLVLGIVLPNFFFHLQTAYAILRMKGVPLGKEDYIAPFKQGPF